MSRPSQVALVIGTALCAVALPAQAVTCYEVIDRTNSVVYRDIRSPIDLSEAGARARDAMRQRGEQLLIFDVDTCIVLGRTTPTGSKVVSVDDIVAEFQSFAGPNSFTQWTRKVGGGADPTLSPGPRAGSSGYR